MCRTAKNRVLRAALVVAIALPGSLSWTAEDQLQEKTARVGILTLFAFEDDPTLKFWFEPFRGALSEQGWTEGKNLSFEYRSARSNPSRFEAAAADLVRSKVDIIVAVGAPAVRAAYRATHTIPIVADDFTNDPVAEGYVRSYGKPDGNLTGTFLDAPEFAGKWFELLKAIFPKLSRVCVLWDPSPGDNHLRAVRSLANSLAIKLQVIEVRTPEDIGRAFATLPGRQQALIILPSPLIFVQSARLAELAGTHRLPATSMARAFAVAGGLLAYGPDLPSTFQSNARLVDKILRGAKPGEIPVERSAKFKLVINLKTAKALGIAIPDSILLRADEVIR